MSLKFPISLAGKRGGVVSGPCGGSDTNQCLESVLDPALTYTFDANCGIRNSTGATNLPAQWDRNSAMKYLYLGTNCISTGGSNTFRGSGLRELYIPDNVNTIAYYTFWDCASLTKVTIGNGLTSVLGNIGFNNCNSLTELNMCRLVAANLPSTFLSGTPNLTEIHVRVNATGYGSVYRGKNVVYDLPEG